MVAEALQGILGELAAGAIVTLLGAVVALVRANTGLAAKNRKLSHFIQQDFKLFAEVSDIVGRIFEETNAQRFLILSANNGIESPRVASAIFETEKEGPGGAVRRYRNVQLDDAYRDMLRKAERDGWCLFTTEEEPACLLKAIYESEGVTESVVIFLKRFEMGPGRDRVFFCTVATRCPNGFSQADETIIQSYAGGLRGVLDHWL